MGRSLRHAVQVELGLRLKQPSPQTIRRVAVNAGGFARNFPRARFRFCFGDMRARFLELLYEQSAFFFGGDALLPHGGNA